MGGDMRRPRRHSLTQQCVESMKQHLLDSGLHAGDRLPTEPEWVEMLGVSRLVVREALQTLAGMGLIDIQQGRGAFVRDTARISVFDQLTFGLDLDQVRYNDVIEARVMLDMAVLELCMLRASPAAISELESIVGTIAQTEAAGQPSEELHREFHRSMLRAANNPLIERIGLALLDTCWRIGDRMTNLVHASAHSGGYHHTESHRALIEAIKAGDVAQSRQLVAEHFPLQSGQEQSYPRYPTIRIDTLWKDA